VRRGLSGLRSGELRTQIEILRPTKTKNARGMFETTWDVVARPYAEVLGQDGREAVISKALEGISSYRIRIRWRGDVRPTDQVRLNGPGGTDLNIHSATDPLGTREQLMIIASTESALKTTAD
jgi:SPP1 family predicted phage head-tail adaptor